MHSVLVIEDQPNIRYLLEAIIQQLGFATITAENGKDGVQRAITDKPDLILMDVMMPEMDGREATRILRAHPETNEIPIITTTGLSQRAVVKSCIDAGCNDYIVKPFTAEELLKKIKALIGRQPPIRENMIESSIKIYPDAGPPRKEYGTKF